MRRLARHMLRLIESMTTNITAMGGPDAGAVKCMPGLFGKLPYIRVSGVVWFAGSIATAGAVLAMVLPTKRRVAA